MDQDRSYLEVSGPSGPGIVELKDSRITLGRTAGSDICIADDPQVSRLHAAFEDYGAGWCIRDLDSRNGTYVEGRRVSGDHCLSPGDRIRVGSTTMVFRSPRVPMPSETEQEGRPLPERTPAELRVLRILCEPILLAGTREAPAPTTDAGIAARLVVSKHTVRFHMRNLYRKFGMEGSAKRIRLARYVADDGRIL